MRCPICGSKSFDDYGGRKNSRCIKCGSLERGRLTWLILAQLDRLKTGVRVLNVSPEPFMLSVGTKIFGPSYIPCASDPSLFDKWNRPVKRIDLCGDLDWQPGSFDVVVHNHVLEHLPCKVAPALRRLNRLLASGGVHLFSAAISPNTTTREDLNPNLSPQDRRRQFGQEGRMRVFGELDFPTLLTEAGMRDGFIDAAKLISPKELLAASIPENALSTLNAHRVLVWSNTKPSPRPALRKPSKPRKR